MSLKDLEEKLDKALGDFRDEVEFDYETAQGPVTKDELRELAKHTFYALNDFKKHIIEYLKNN